MQPFTTHTPHQTGLWWLFSHLGCFLQVSSRASLPSMSHEAVGKEPICQLRLIEPRIATWDFIARLLAGFAVWHAMKPWDKPQDGGLFSPLSRAICSTTLWILNLFADLRPLLSGSIF